MEEFNLEDCVKENLAKNPQRVSHALNLVLRLKNPLQMPELLLKIQAAQPNIRRALSELNFVHFARFLPTRDNTALQVITEFDGPLEPYVMDFAIAIGEEFSMMLCYVTDSDRPLLPVKDNPDEFWEFVKKNNRVYIGPVPLPASVDYPLYSAYPDLSVLDIVGPRKQLPPPAADRPAAPIDHADVQGNILRGYHAYYARHFALQVTAARSAREWFAALATAPQGDVPAIRNDVDWGPRKPPAVLNVGFTFEGLRALGFSDGRLTAFPAAFREGPAHDDRAKANGDIGDSVPVNWRLGKPGDPVHVLLSLYAFEGEQPAFDRASAAINAALPAAGLRLLSSHDAEALGSTDELRNQIHFGYRDGVSEPRIADPCAVPTDMQPAASPGEFLLHPAYTDIFGGKSIGKLPPEIASNGSFCAVRLLQQHVNAFDQLLKDGAAQLGATQELLAAKLMGRWQDGTPLALFPDEDTKTHAQELDRTSNDFDYAPSHEYPETFHDHDGLRCPVGAHIRRTNPRTARVAGARYSRRLIRRGMPYTVAGSSGAPNEKGLFGLFFCGSLERQFEFIQQQWIDGDLFASGIRGTQDPIVGAQTMNGTFGLPGMGPLGTTAELKVPRLTTTRGSLYLFVPGMAALRGLGRMVLSAEQIWAQPLSGPPGEEPDFVAQRVRLKTILDAELTEPVRHSLAEALFAPLPTAHGQLVPGASAGAFDPNRFDPTDRGFLANPYPTFAEFRNHFPVYYVPRHEAYWVFTRALIVEMCTRTDHFLKMPPNDTTPRGLFQMEKKRHAVVRPLMDKAFGVATTNARRYAVQASTQALDAVQGTCFDLVDKFSRRIAGNVLFDVMGIPAGYRADIDKLARTVMMHADHTLDTLQRLLGKLAGAELVVKLTATMLVAPRGTLINQIAWMVVRGELKATEAVMTLLHFVMGGYLSTEFLLCTGTRNLLLNNRNAWQFLQARSPVADPTVDAPLLAAIDEMRRYDTPLGVIDRYAGHDGRVAGRRGVTLGTMFIPEGARLSGMLGSANRDPAASGPSPEAFDIRRCPPMPHIALGHGVRSCIGTPLQQLVAPIALAMLIKRMPNLRLLSPAQPPWFSDPYFRSFERLVVGEH